MTDVSNFSRAFRKDERGAATAWSIFWLMTFLVTAGLIIDTSNAYRYKNALQASANASALAAIISYREKPKFDKIWPSETPANELDRAKIAGHNLANLNMDPTRNISTVTPKTEVDLGYWDTATRTFYPVGSIPSGQDINAAKARALRTASNSNPLNLLLVDIFGAVGSWDVGESAVARAFDATGCPTQEGVMANKNLNFASNNVFTGEICLHAELKADFNTNSEWHPDDDGDKPVISYGFEGAACKGLDNCKTEAPYNNLTGFQSATYPLTDDMIVGPAARMPDLLSIYEYYGQAIANPSLYTGVDVTQNRYIPPMLTTNPDRDPTTTAAILEPLPTGGPQIDENGNVVIVQGQIQYTDSLSTIATNMNALGGILTTTGGVMRVSIDGKDFNDAVDDADGTGINPFPPNTIIEVDLGTNCRAQGNKITLSSDTPLEDLVIATSCRIEFNGTNRVANTMIYSTFDGSTTAVSGNSGAMLGDGTCSDKSDGALVVTSGKVHFAAGMQAHSSRIIALKDITIAAQADGLRGSQIMGNDNIHIAAQAGWEGCDSSIGYGGDFSDFYYALVD